LGPQTSAAIEYHVRSSWPSGVRVAFAVQPVPLGTAHAVLCARELVPDGPFAVVNADDVYGADAMRLLAKHLGDEPEEHATVAFALRDSVVNDSPVTRGTCVVEPGGLLSAIIERRKVTVHDDGRATSDDGLEPHELDPDVLVSVNLWGFNPSLWPVLEAAVLSVHGGVAPDGSIRDPNAIKRDVEVLLPEVIGDLIAGRSLVAPRSEAVRVLRGPGRCLGVTHADDLPVVRSELASMVGQGVRPEATWEAFRGGPPTESR
ncbi:MAG: sugar phosphate nucleotidyltransferase, partial [Acidimicrobiales bacterium]